MASPATVRVDDDLATSEARISGRSADDKVAARVDVVDGALVEVLLGNDHLDDLLEDGGAQGLEADALRVLHRDDDRVDAHGDGRSSGKVVLAGDLRLRVRTGPGELATATQFGNLGIELVREDDRQWHELLRLVGGVAEHETLVPGAHLLIGAVLVHARGNLWALLLEGELDLAVAVVEAWVESLTRKTVR